MTKTAVTRKRLLASGAAAAGALAIPKIARSAPKSQSIFKLVPNKATCGACLGHDAASLFPTRKAADGNRAHIGCNCDIVKGSVDYGTFVALFGRPIDLRSYRADRRSTRTRAILQGHEPVFPR
jgi:hypothetical protein